MVNVRGEDDHGERGAAPLRHALGRAHEHGRARTVQHHRDGSLNGSAQNQITTTSAADGSYAFSGLDVGTDPSTP